MLDHGRVEADGWARDGDLLSGDPVEYPRVAAVAARQAAEDPDHALWSVEDDAVA